MKGDRAGAWSMNSSGNLNYCHVHRGCRVLPLTCMAVKASGNSWANIVQMYSHRDQEWLPVWILDLNRTWDRGSGDRLRWLLPVNTKTCGGNFCSQICRESTVAVLDTGFLGNKTCWGLLEMRPLGTEVFLAVWLILEIFPSSLF